MTLVPLEDLVVRERAAGEEAKGLTSAAESANQSGLAHFAEAGRLLVEHRAEWTSSPVAALLDHAAALGQQIAGDHQRLAEDSTDTGQPLSNLWKRVSTLKERGHLSADEAAATAELQTVLAQIAEAPNAAELTAARSSRDAGASDLAQSRSLRSAAAAKSAEAGRIADEVARRNAAIRSMGFDSLYLAGRLQSQGPSPIPTALVLKKGEEAYVEMPATLARHGKKTEWVGGSQGFSFPIAHTGTRYRVGSYRGHPVEHEVLKPIDGGSLVLTNLRLAFLGKSKLVSIPLAKVAKLDSYTDGVSVFQENKEDPNVFLVQPVNYLVFYLNYLLGRQ